MTKHTYVYVIYILTTPEKIWEAITDRAISATYWGRENISDWKVGSSWAHQIPGQSPDGVGEVLKADPPRRLVLTWASPADRGDPDGTSQAAFDIEELGGKVKLTLTHTDLNEQTLQGVSFGWPAVLSNLKTLLETGNTIPNPFGAA